MRLIVITANLMQRLAGLPTTPDITLLDLRKPKPHPRSHTNTTFRELTYIRWCCIDLSNAPRLPGKWPPVSLKFSRQSRQGMRKLKVTVKLVALPSGETLNLQ